MAGGGKEGRERGQWQRMEGAIGEDVHPSKYSRRINKRRDQRALTVMIPMGTPWHR